MLDALVRHLVQEIGAQGTIGIHPNRIASLAQDYFDEQAAALLHAAPSATARRRSAGQFNQVLDQPYISYLLGVLLEHEDVLLVAGKAPSAVGGGGDGEQQQQQPAGAEPARHTISRERYAEVGLPALELEYGERLSIQLGEDAACLIIAGQRREYLTFSDLTLSILSTISSRDSVGISSVQISKLYSIPPKDVFYHTKKLVQEQLVAKLNVTEDGAHTTHFIHRRFLSRSAAYLMTQATASTAPDAPLTELPRGLLLQYELIEPRAMAVFDAQPRGVIRTLQLYNKDGWFARQMGYRGRIDPGVYKASKTLVQVLAARGKIRRINIRNTTAVNPARGLLPAYQSMSHVENGVDSSVEVAVGVEELESAVEADLRPIAEAEPDGEAGIVLYDPAQVEPEQPLPRFMPAAAAQASTTIDYQVLQFILESGTAGRSFRDVIDRFAFSRRFLEYGMDHWALREGAPRHLPQTSLIQVTNNDGKESRLVLFGLPGYRALCQQLDHPVDPTVCPPTDREGAGGFLSLHEFELWDEPQQRVEWAESYPAETFRPATLSPRDLIPFLPAQSETLRVSKNDLRELLGSDSHGEFLGSYRPSGVRPKSTGRAPGRVVGPQKKQIERIHRILAGEEDAPSDATGYRLLAGRAEAIGLTLPPRPTSTRKRGRSSSVASSMPSASPAPATPTAKPKKRARSSTKTDVETEGEAVASSSSKPPPRKARRKSTLSQVVVPEVDSPASGVVTELSLPAAPPAAAACPSTSTVPTSTPAKAPVVPPIPVTPTHAASAGVGKEATLSETEGRPRKARRTQSSLPAEATPLSASAPAPSAAAPASASSQPQLEPSTSTESLLLVEPRPVRPPETPSQAVGTPRVRAVRKKGKTPALPKPPSGGADGSQATPSSLKSRTTLPPSSMGPPSAANTPSSAAHSASAVPSFDIPGPSAAGVSLPNPLPATVDFNITGPAPPVEDARARLRRKQQEAEAAKAERKKQRRERDVVEMDLGETITRTGRPARPPRVPKKPGERKERKDKGQPRGDKKAGRWIFPSEDRKTERQKRVSKKASAAGAATADDLTAAAAAAAAALAEEAEAAPPPVEHGYLPLTPEDDDLIPDIVNQVGRISGSDAQRHRTRHNDELDDVIMDIGAIICVRGSAPGHMYSWKPALDVIRGVTTTTVRNRFHKLQETRGSYIYQLESAYLRMWNTVGATPLLPDPKKLKHGQFDLPHHLKFFRKNIDKDLLRANADVVQIEGKKEMRAPELPGHVGAMQTIKLEDNPNVAHDAFDFTWLHVTRYNMSDDQSELAARNNLFLIAPSVPEPLVADSGRREDSVLASTVKMVCSTLDEDFDPRKAEEILPKGGRPGEVIKQLIAEGVCDSRTDHINGRIGFSEQFAKFSAGVHPASFFTEAAEVEGSVSDSSLLIEQEFTLWPLIASDGHTAALLHLASQNRVELETEQAELENLCAGPNLRNSKKLDDEQLEFHISARLTRAKSLEDVAIDVPPSVELDHGPIAVDQDARAAVLASLTDGDESGLMAIGKRIVEYLDLVEVGGDGATWAILAALCPELKQQDLLHLVLELAETTPPLVFVSGYDRPRLVSTLSVPAWAAFIPTPSSPTPAVAELAEATAPDVDEAAPSEVSKVMVWPRRWVDLNAHVVEKDWDDCVRLVIGHLLDRSGISETDLRQTLSPVLDRLEMSELLRHLLQLHIARRVLYPASSLSPKAITNAELAEWPVGWLALNDEKRIGWELVGGSWIDGLNDQDGPGYGSA